ncbi:MAG: hypothetical protein LBE24_01835 [Methylobacillus sp.]|jgi:hypothetical protein|nr:hypothetical protein [Methylobacillus sp.]
MMQKRLKLFMLLGVTTLFLSPFAAISKEIPEMTQKQAEEMAKVIYRKDIAAGKVTLQQAGAYYKCSEGDYMQKYMNSPEGKKHMQGPDKVSASEIEVLEKFREQSQDKCVKQLGLKEKPKEGM